MKYKMYKAKRSWKIAPVLATGLLGGIIASEQNVSADTAVNASSVNSNTISNSDSTSASASIHSSTIAVRRHKTLYHPVLVHLVVQA
ncbi:MAG: KxYKxGKxW signal peptide domain-containing protein [Firmicutes bacterium]|uniref:KxYKxGKxW signal peptide domain-containing protein n=1 Tax=Candidatus Gallilactobacillus intestinavium TaxID=2840838 RepID=A0A9D9E6F9_9LACO|nr:KxYKxGKxW signal peptide domain-containing protein [Candidatus Gallilactobacillus intestinavium]